MNVVPMTAHELEAAVLKPAERAGVKAETALLAELVAEMADRPGGLPMLQYTLTELFDQQTDGTLTLAGYRGLGGLRGILSHRAEDVYAELGAEEQRVAMQVFLRLVRLGDGGVESRRQTPLSELTDLDLDPVGCRTCSSRSDAIGSSHSIATRSLDRRPWRWPTRLSCASGIDWLAGSIATAQPCADTARSRPRSRNGSCRAGIPTTS